MLRLRDSLGEFWACDEGPGWAQFWPGYVDGVWEDYTLARLRSFDWSGPRDVFVDVGAWIGPVTLWGARLGAQVLALEPDPVAFAALGRTVAANRLWNVLPLCAALTRKSGIVHLASNRTGEYGDSSSFLATLGRPVAGFALPDLLEELGVSPGEVAFVKVDVEGYERKLLPTLGPWLEEHGIAVQVAEHDERGVALT